MRKAPENAVQQMLQQAATTLVLPATTRCFSGGLVAGVQQGVSEVKAPGNCQFLQLQRV
jgi:hypothetical protein